MPLTLHPDMVSPDMVSRKALAAGFSRESVPDVAGGQRLAAQRKWHWVLARGCCHGCTNWTLRVSRLICGVSWARWPRLLFHVLVLKKADRFLNNPGYTTRGRVCPVPVAEVARLRSLNGVIRTLASSATGKIQPRVVSCGLFT